MLIDEIVQLTRDACHNRENRLSESYFEEHVTCVAYFAEKLCTLLNADREIVLLSAYLHDISAIVDYTTIATHNIESARIAENILIDYGYSKDRVSFVRQAIINHTSPMGYGNGSIEEICVSNADAISIIIKPAFWLNYAYTVQSMSFNDGYHWYQNKVSTNWNSLIEPAQELIIDQYHTIMDIFVNCKHTGHFKK
jgi:uncharacterized protein